MDMVLYAITMRKINIDDYELILKVIGMRRIINA